MVVTSHRTYITITGGSDSGNTQHY